MKRLSLALQLACLCGFAVTGCGLKGDLYLDEEPVVEAVVPDTTTDDTPNDTAATE